MKKEKKMCFFCMNETDEDVFQIGDYCLCNKCNSVMEEGVTIIGVTEKQNIKDQSPIVKLTDGTDLYPTGEWMTLTEETISILFKPEIANEFIEKRKGFIPNEVMKEIKNIYKNTALNGKKIKK